MTAFTIDSHGVNFANFGYASKVSGGAYVYPNPWGDFDSLLPANAIANLRAAGVKVVRYQLDPTPFYLFSNNWEIDGLLAAAFLPLQRFTAAGIKVILDMHDQYGPAVSTVYNATDILTNAQRLGLMCKIKAYVARKMAAYYSPSQVAFELFNEVSQNADWSRTLCPSLFRAVRAAVPNHTLVVSGDTWANASGLVKLNAADFDDNTLYTFHDYAQQICSHQSILPEYFGEWDGLSYLTRVEFPPDQRKKMQMAASAFDNVDADIWHKSLDANNKQRLKAQINRLCDDYYDTPYDKNWMRRTIYDPVKVWAQSQGVALSRIFLGETGCWGDVGGKQGADMTTRVNFIRTKRELCDEIGIKVSVHELIGTPTTAWQLVSGRGLTELAPEFAAAMFGGAAVPVPPPIPVPTPPPPPKPVPAPPTLGRGIYTLPAGWAVTGNVLTVP